MKSSQFNILADTGLGGNPLTTADPVLIDQIYGFSVQVMWDGNPVGDWKLQGSCDPIYRGVTGSTRPLLVTNWTDIEGTTIAAGGGPGTILYNLNGAFYNFVRLVFAWSSGDGIANANMVVKGE